MLGLKVRTDAAWVREALRDVDALLADHAHCEMKAASNALSLAARHPHDLELVRALADVAREEIEHFQRVLAVLAERAVALGPPVVDAYAAELRRAAADLTGTAGVGAGVGSGAGAGSSVGQSASSSVLVDRLLVGALIEARSCERFKLLAEATEQGEHAALHALWSELLAAEARHYTTFVELAVRAAEGDRARVAARLDRLADAEGRIVTELSRDTDASRTSIHG
jgi:tRNA-(ms[2]io[6]A)-hydroxylase